MTVNKTFFYTAIPLLLVVFLFQGIVSAEAYQALAPLPDVATGDEGTGFMGYLNTLFKVIIIAAAMLAVLKIAIGGFQYMMTDVITTKAGAKKDITGALLGLGIILSTTLVLSTIYGGITNLNVFEGASNLQLGKQGTPLPIGNLSDLPPFDGCTSSVCQELCAEEGGVPYNGKCYAPEQFNPAGQNCGGITDQDENDGVNDNLECYKKWCEPYGVDFLDNGTGNKSTGFACSGRKNDTDQNKCNGTYEVTDETCKQFCRVEKKGTTVSLGGGLGKCVPSAQTKIVNHYECKKLNSDVSDTKEWQDCLKKCRDDGYQRGDAYTNTEGTHTVTPCIEYVLTGEDNVSTKKSFFGKTDSSNNNFFLNPNAEKTYTPYTTKGAPIVQYPPASLGFNKQQTLFNNGINLNLDNSTRNVNGVNTDNLELSTSPNSQAPSLPGIPTDILNSLDLSGNSSTDSKSVTDTKDGGSTDGGTDTFNPNDLILPPPPALPEEVQEETLNN